MNPRRKAMYLCKTCGNEFSNPKLFGGTRYTLVAIKDQNAQCPSCLSVVIERQEMRINKDFEAEIQKMESSLTGLEILRYDNSRKKPTFTRKIRG
jgi:DNA-directed RNA polymerase subunit RPC12/RpoP